VPIDFLALNYYTRALLTHDPADAFLQVRDVRTPTPEWTEMEWEVFPQGLYDVLTRLHNDYSFPALYITENGAAFPDEVNAAGQVNDERRVAYLAAHFAEASRAISAGVPLKGYFVWSLMDNFEWALGYTKRFGIIYVDYATQQRIIKQSGHWYKDYIGQLR
jgi:beta-glucosidase